MKVEQSAGVYKLHVWTDGSPLWPKLTIEGGEEIAIGHGTQDLHDLRYCIDRLLAKLPEHRRDEP